MKRQWLLLVFPVALVGVLLAVKHFSKKPGGEEVVFSKPVTVLKDTTVVPNVPRDVVPRPNDATKSVQPEAVEKVASILEKYVKEHPDAADIGDAYYNLGTTYYQSGQYEKAIEPLRKAIEYHPYDADAHFTLGNAYTQLKRYKEAAQEFETMIKIEPKNDAVFYNLGNAYLNMKEYDQAIAKYKEALALNPKNSATHYVLGFTYGAQHRYKDASDELQQAITLDPNNAEARYYLAMAKLEAGDKEGAKEQYELLKKSNPQYADEINKRMSN